MNRYVLKIYSVPSGYGAGALYRGAAAATLNIIISMDIEMYKAYRAGQNSCRDSRLGCWSSFPQYAVN